MVTIKSHVAYVILLVAVTAVDFCPALLVPMFESVAGNFPENVLK